MCYPKSAEKRLTIVIWVCRAGKDSIFLDNFLCNERVSLPWEGFRVDLKQYSRREQIKSLVQHEKGDVARTSISNWSGQLYSFCWEMNVGDYVLIPHRSSRTYTFAKIIGDYEFRDSDPNGLWHSRKIRIVLSGIPRELFSQSMRYSLGAYRTIFKVREEEELLKTISKYQQQKK